MKTIAFPCALAVSICGLAMPGFGQNLGFSEPSANGLPRGFSTEAHLLDAPGLPPAAYQVPAVEHANPAVPDAELVLNDTAPAAAKRPTGLTGLLSKPSALGELASHPSQPGLEASVKEMQLGLALLTAVYRPQGDKVASADCPLLAIVIERRVAAEPAKVLEFVESEVSLNPNCACEIVKAAIKGSEADAAMVASIVETACMAAPEMMRIISQCAIATVPDALAGVQAVLAKLDPNAGRPGDSSKSAKSGKDAKIQIAAPPPPPVAADPLDLPPAGPPIIPPPFFPPPVTDVVGRK